MEQISSGASQQPLLDAALTTALRLFVRRGYGGFSLLDVAQHARISEWDVMALGLTKAQLVAAATDLGIRDHLPCPDGGTLRRDLVELVRRQLRIVRSQAKLCERAWEARLDAEFAKAAWELELERRTSYLAIFERARARGELDADVDFDTVLDLSLGQVWGRLVHGRSLRDGVAPGIVELVVVGLAPRTSKIS